MNNTGFIFTLIASFAILYIGIISVYHDRKSISNRFFAAISIATVLWSFANYFSLYPILFDRIYWARLVLFFAIPHAVFFYFFVRNFPSKNLIIPWRHVLGVSTFAILTMGLVLTDGVFVGLQHVGNAFVPIPGSQIPLFAIFVIGLVLASVIQIIRKYFHANNLEKNSWRLMLLGFVTSYVYLIVTNFVLVNANGDTSFILYAPAFMIPSIIGTAYSILRYRLLNIKALATEVIAFVLLAATLAQVFLSQTTGQFIFNIILFVTFLFLSVLLVRSVLREVEQKEELEHLTAALEQANEKLKSLDKLKTEFLSLASHQLRSPLTAIKGYTSMLLEGSFGEIGKEQKEAIDRVFQSSKHLANVVEDLLNVSKIEQGGMKYEMAQFDLEKAAKDLATDLSVTASKKGLALTFETDNDGPYTAYGDMEKIRQVILNLIDNSIKYTKKGFIKVRLERKRGSDKLIFSVTDSGMGMTAETKASLFQKFSRGEGGKVDASGSGLGLYLAKEIVEAHHGRVWIDSPGLEKGSTFSVELPYYHEGK